MQKKAVILLSGGLDSTTILAYAIEQGYDVYGLSFSYGQRHAIELQRATEIAKHYHVKEHKIAQIDLRLFGGSALTDDITVPKHSHVEDIGAAIPITYVPARNTIFLSFALAWAETLQAYDIFIGVNAVDYSGYPDCRPEFINAFEAMANVATAYATQAEKRITIHTPLIHYTKAEIIAMGMTLGVDYSKTISCYDPAPDGTICGQCDSCLLRAKGFADYETSIAN
jgi:7-cyano-7-deazaguanine synthase